MVISKRTKLSFCQLLDLIGKDQVDILLEKHDVSVEDISLVNIREALLGVGDVIITSLISEVISTKKALKEKIRQQLKHLMKDGETLKGV